MVSVKTLDKMAKVEATPKCYLLDIVPFEIREQIYYLALEKRDPHVRNETRPNLLRTCSMISSEAKAALHYTQKTLWIPFIPPMLFTGKHSGQPGLNQVHVSQSPYPNAYACDAVQPTNVLALIEKLPQLELMFIADRADDALQNVKEYVIMPSLRGESESYMWEPLGKTATASDNLNGAWYCFRKALRTAVYS